MRIGFTGTRHGMTEAQKERFFTLFVAQLVSPDENEFHHGDCVGADDDAANLVHEFRTKNCLIIPIVAHPGPAPNGPLAAINPHADERRLPYAYCARNRHIVDECELLIATPAEMSQQNRGGTWFTVKYAARTGTPLFVIWPDGTVSDAADLATKGQSANG